MPVATICAERKEEMMMSFRNEKSGLCSPQFLEGFFTGHLWSVKACWQTQIPDRYILGVTVRRTIPSREEKNPIETWFYLDTDFTRLWRCNLHLLNRERFSRSPGNSSSASDNLEATERITLQGRVCLWRTMGLVTLQSPQTEE